MKTSLLQLSFLTCFLFLIQISSYAQPEFAFKNARLLSGTNFKIGAKYQFPSVKPGVDAIVTLSNIMGSISLTAIDDNSTGFDEAFQPFINVPSNSNGYVEFKFEFVAAGTGTLLVQDSVPVTCTNVDGSSFVDGKLYEQDQVEFINGYYDFNMTGTSLQVLNPPGWISIKNTTAVSYPGIDTSVNDIMSTVVNLNISSFKIRVGAMNTSPTNTGIRSRSFYFKRFTYPDAILFPNRTLLNFSGMEKNNGVDLNGTLSASHTYNKLIIERGNSVTTLEKITEMNLDAASSAVFTFSYFDNHPGGKNNFYRVRLINTSQKIYELSNILVVNLNTGKEKDFELYNTVLRQGAPSLNVKSKENSQIVLRLVDMSGRVAYTSTELLNPGTNNINISKFDLLKGYYVLDIKNNKTSIRQKIIIQ